MSQTLTKVAKPDPAKDLEAIEQFKERFKGKHANDLEKARVECSNKQAPAFKAEQLATSAEAASKEATKQWTDKKNLRERKKSPPPESDPEKVARLLAEQKQNEAKLAREAADPLIKAYETARDELAKLLENANRAAQRSAVKDQVHALAGRLNNAAEAAKKTGGNEATKTDLAAKLWHDFQDAIDKKKLAEFEKTLPAVEKTVIDAIADVALEPAKVALEKRIAARESGIGAMDKAAVKDLREKLATATLFELEKTLIPVVEAAEQPIEEFDSLKADLADRIKALRTQAVPEKTCAELDKELLAAIKAAPKSLPDALKLLGTVETKVGEQEDEVAWMDQAKADYPGALADVNKLIDDFNNLTPPSLKSFMPGNRNGEIAKAAKWFKEGMFIYALDVLQDLEIVLKTGLKQADAAKRGLLQDAQDAVAKQEQERLKEEKRLKDEAAQLKKEQADVPACLDAIGRDKKFAVWYNRVKALLDKGIVTANAGGTIPLSGGDTIEVPVFVNATGGFQRQFVVHYHKGAKPPDSNNPWASKVHAKPNRGNKTTPRVYLNGGDWVFKYAPKLSEV
jgi:hypothetical protein